MRDFPCLLYVRVIPCVFVLVCPSVSLSVCLSSSPSVYPPPAPVSLFVELSVSPASLAQLKTQWHSLNRTGHVGLELPNNNEGASKYWTPAGKKWRRKLDRPRQTLTNNSHSTRKRVNKSTNKLQKQKQLFFDFILVLSTKCCSWRIRWKVIGNKWHSMQLNTYYNK